MRRTSEMQKCGVTRPSLNSGRPSLALHEQDTAPDGKSKVQSVLFYGAKKNRPEAAPDTLHRGVDYGSVKVTRLSTG